MAQATKSRRTKAVSAPTQAERRPLRGSGGPDFWTRLSGRTQHVVCILFLFAVSLAFFAPVHFGGKSLIAGDTIQWRAMAQEIIAHEEATGERALWAPNAFAGMPAYTISYEPPVPQLDNIPTLIRPFLWPTSHFFLLLLGTYLLVTFLTGQKLSGVLAACAYGLTTYLPVLLTAGHNSKFIALCYAPWLLLAFAYALRRPGLLSALCFAAALALNLRAGHVQITYYLAFLLGIWWIAEAVGAGRKGRIKAFGAVTGWMALGTVLGILMIAQPYLLLQEYKRFSTRGGGSADAPQGLGWQYAMNWSQGIGELLTLIIADARGGSSLYWGPKVFTAGPHYVGGIVAVLALFAVLWVRRSMAIGLGIAALVLTLFSLGENFALLNQPMFYYFPLFSAFRAPETWLSAVALAVAVLAGIGAGYLARREESAEAEARKTRSVYVALGAVGGLVLLFLVVGGSVFDYQKEGELERISQAIAQQSQADPASPQVIAAAREYLANNFIAPRREAFRSDALRTLLLLIFAGGLVFLYRRGTLPAWGLQSALALLVLVDLWGVGKRYFREETLTTASAIESQIPTYDFDQFILERQQEAGGLGHFRVISFERGDPLTNARPSYHYESLGGYSAAKVRLFQEFIEQAVFQPQTGLPRENALDLLNTRYLIIPSNAVPAFPEYTVAYTSPQGLTVLENPDATPRAFFVDNVEVMASLEQTLERIKSPAFDPARTAILSEQIDFTSAPLGPGSQTGVTLQEYTPDEIAWRVRTDALRLMVVSEIYYPAGWKAYVDGEEVPIHRANYLLRAVPVPAGEHTVEMRFEPGTERLSFWLSAIFTVVVYGGIAALLTIRFTRRRKETDSTPESADGGAAASL